MFFWKMDEETIRCLINKDEITKMGYDIQALGTDSDVMEDFLNTIVSNSKNYINWNTDNGIQNYVARALPADQFLITISCTLQDVAIDRDLDQIEKMTSALHDKISAERINEIRAMTGEEKAKHFEELAKDLHNVCMGNTEETDEGEGGVHTDAEMYQEMMRPQNSEESASRAEASAAENTLPDTVSAAASVDRKTKEDSEQIKPYIPAQKMVFKNFHTLLDFCSLLNEQYFIPSTLYRDGEEYVLLVEFPPEMDSARIISFMITAEEYGAQCSNQKFDGYYLSEHGKMIIRDRGIETLYSMR